MSALNLRSSFINDAPALSPNSPSLLLVPALFMTGDSSIDGGNHTFSRPVRSIDSPTGFLTDEISSLEEIKEMFTEGLDSNTLKWVREVCSPARSMLTGDGEKQFRLERGREELTWGLGAYLVNTHGT
nr:hypothetical protein Itr_chr15CG12800 [Ipomoea trifida]